MAKRASATSKKAPKLVAPKEPSTAPEVIEQEPFSVFGWTLQRVQDARMAIDAGRMYVGHELMLAMTTYPAIKHGLKLRRDTLAQVPFYFEKPDGLSQEYFDQWVAHWPVSWPRPEQGLANGHKIMLGLSPLNTTWERHEGEALDWRPLVHVKEPGSVEWYETQRIYRFQALVGALTETGKRAPDPVGPLGQMGIIDMWPLDGARWLMLKEEPVRPHQHGAARSMAVDWYYGSEAYRWHSSHNRIHGIEWVGIKMPMGQRETPDSKSLLTTVTNLDNSLRVIPLPQSDDKDKASYGMEVFGAKTEAHKTFVSQYEKADDRITLLLLGAAENTQGGGGSLAKAQTQDRVSLRLTKGDCAGIVEVHDQLARTACEANGIDPALAPRLMFSVDDPADQALATQKQEQAAAAGQSIGTLITQIEVANTARAVAKQPLIEYEPDYLLEQVGIMLTRKQDGEQTRPR